MSQVKDVDNKKPEKDEARFAQILRMKEEDKIKKEAMGEHLTSAYATLANIKYNKIRTLHNKSPNHHKRTSIRNRKEKFLWFQYNKCELLCSGVNGTLKDESKSKNRHNAKKPLVRNFVRLLPLGSKPRIDSGSPM
ncbi:hypothetical protein HZH66_004782 [Vespula vulgaris]|uniref:Uncharacterized protein n=1 Tax=Vespula vulgaris TaxID=7454 RepID=A0A834NB61_VESVU|nr:hypothetical protein HZH66_004782 [Vespula vulgaris]